MAASRKDIGDHAAAIDVESFAACPGCGTTTCAALPAGVPTGQFGARLLAFTVFDCRVRNFFLAVRSASALAWDISVRANVVRRFFCQTC